MILFHLITHHIWDCAKLFNINHHCCYFLNFYTLLAMPSDCCQSCAQNVAQVSDRDDYRLRTARLIIKQYQSASCLLCTQKTFV